MDQPIAIMEALRHLEAAQRALKDPHTPPEDLFQALRRWRTEQARSRAMPPYVVATDAVLREIASRQPRTPEDLRSIRGMGPAKVETYGAELLRIVEAAAFTPTPPAPAT